MINKATAINALVSIAALTGSMAHADDLKLPPLTPNFCSRSICIFARGPYAVESFSSATSNKSEVIIIAFQDGTRISFAAVPTDADCSARLSKKWNNEEGGLKSKAYLCVPTIKGGNTVVAVAIASSSPYTTGRYQDESEICAWGFSLDRVESDGKSTLPLGPEKCVGNRLGWANPAIEKPSR